MKTALENQWQLIPQVRFSNHRDPQPATASRKQHDKRTYQIEFKIWTYQFSFGTLLSLHIQCLSPVARRSKVTKEQDSCNELHNSQLFLCRTQQKN
ncbi:MAG: hypothetical protein WCA35_13810 [Kovacikia sp.]